MQHELHTGPSLSVFGPFGQPGKYRKNKWGPIMSNFWGWFFHVFGVKKVKQTTKKVWTTLNDSSKWNLIQRKNKGKRTGETKSPLYLSDATRTPDDKACRGKNWTFDKRETVFFYLKFFLNNLNEGQIGYSG